MKGFASLPIRWRWPLLLATVLAMATSERSLWAMLLALPLLGGAAVLHFFTREDLERWLERGNLFAADAALVLLALLAAGLGRPVLFLGLCCVMLIAACLQDAVRSVIGGFAALGALVALASAGLVQRLELFDLLYLPLLGSAVAHFSDLARRLGPRPEPAAGAPSESGESWALLEITDTITSTLDVSLVMHSIVDKVGDLAGTPSCSILLVDQQSPTGFVVASKGHPEAEMMPLDLAKYPEVRQAIRTRAAVVVEDVATDPLIASAREVLLSQGVQSLLVLPLLYGKEVLGTLFLKSRTRGSFSPGVLRFCKVAACISANALKNAMLFRDVTREGARHRETGEKLRRLLDGTPDMIVATDTQGRITEFNRGAEALTGLVSERCLGRRLTEIIPAATELAPHTSRQVPQDVPVSSTDGRQLKVSFACAPLWGPGEEQAGCVWIGRDMTQLRQAEQSLAQAERLSSLGEVVAGVAHELNNPLSGVVGYAELLRANASDPEQIRDLDRIVESALRCQRIVFKLLSFARKHPPEKKHRSLNDCVRKVLDLRSYHLRSSQIQTVLELDPDLPWTCFDFHQLEQVIMNLLNNAEQAVTSVKRSGSIVIRTGHEGDQLYVEVEDDGPGVAPAIRERLFDPFFTTKEVGQGTGLGLSVSYGIVQQHGGRIELLARRSGQGGSRFRVSLPIVQGPAAVEDETAEELTGRPNPLRGRRVLVAEDEPVVLELLARLLADEGAQATLARDGMEAWELLAEREFDLVVADLRMPNLSGQQLYERVAEARPELLRRFVFATGDLIRHETLAFLEGLPNRILTKPLEIETVRRVLSQALDAAA